MTYIDIVVTTVLDRRVVQAFGASTLVESTLYALLDYTQTLQVAQGARATGIFVVVRVRRLKLFWREVSILGELLVRWQSLHQLFLLFGDLAPSCLVLRSIPVKIVSTVRPAPSLIWVTQWRGVVLPQPANKVHICLVATEVSYKATRVLNDIWVTARAIRPVLVRRCRLEGSRVHILLNLVWTPHHVLFLIARQTSIIHHNVRVSARPIAHIACILGVKCPRHGGLHGRMGVSGRMTYWMVTAISHAFRCHYHFASDSVTYSILRALDSQLMNYFWLIKIRLSSQFIYFHQN